MPSREGMYETACAICGKTLYTYATDRRGSIPEVTCSLICKSQLAEKKQREKGKR
jgi:hypothetical protein